MARQLKLHGFIIRVGKSKLCKVIKPGSIYDGSLMIVAPFSVYNIRTTTRRFANDYYNYIVKGTPQKTSVKADYAFSDSLINKQVKPKQTVSGYIRIPFNGRGLYGVRFLDINNKFNKNITWPYNNLPTQSVPFNHEGDYAQVLGLEIKQNNKKSPQQKQVKPPSAKVKIVKTKQRKNKSRYEEKPLINSDGKDMYDFAGEYESRNIEYGHGRRKSDEWNNMAALDLKRELDNLRKVQRDDPNTFDRGAMK